MTARISENYLSRPFTVGVRDSGRELVFDIQDAADEAEVLSLLEATAPASYRGLLLDSFAGEPVTDILWKGTARYVRLEDGNEYTFDTSGGTQHLTQSLGTVNAYALSGLTPADFRGAVGVSDDRVEGVDIVSPKFDFSETHIFENSFVDLGYKQLLFRMTGKVNDASFKGLAAGECLFMGAAGTIKGDTRWSITFRFSGSANASGFDVGDITGVDKDGWDYLWIRYADSVDDSAKCLVKQPISCYVERVYPRADFSTLLIGT